MPGLVLQGHLDVVPPGDPDNWLGSNPFSAEIREGAHVRPRHLRHEGRRGRQPRRRSAPCAPPASGSSGRWRVHCVIGEEDGGLGRVRDPAPRATSARRR